MKRMLRAAAVLFVLALTTAGCAELNLPADGWVTLIDGERGLDNFTRVGDANWRAEGGAIVADKGNPKVSSHLVTKKPYRDFEIYAEFWVTAQTNSGIFIRAQDPKNIGAANAYEVNIWDTRPDPTYGTGAIVGFASVNPMPKAGGKWSTLRVTARGPQLTVQFDGAVTVNHRDTSFASGPISLQYGSGVVKFRKLEIRDF